MGGVLEITGAKKALIGVRVPYEGLPPHEPGRTWALRRRQSEKRGYLMAQQFLEAENREQALVEIAERWGYRNIGAARRMIERVIRGDFALTGAHAARLNAIREVKRAEVMRDSDARRGFLDREIYRCERLLTGGEEWGETRVEDGVGKDADGFLPCERRLWPVRVLDRLFRQ